MPRTQYSDGKRVTLSYNEVNSRTAMQDAGGITAFSYDELNRPKAVTYPGPKTVTYAYDAVGNRQVLTDPDGGITTYSYDSRNLLSWLLNPNAERSTWVYDAIGRVTTMTYGNGAIAETDFDSAGRTAALRNLKADRSVLSIFTYSYDNAGNRTAVAEANGDRVTWSYDEIYQLTREQRSGANAYDITYSYDAVGNRLSKLEGGTTTTYSYDAANQLNVEVTPSARTTYAYDANGNTQVTNAAGSLTTYAWDIENHLTVAQLPAGGRTTATYDGQGNRRSYHDSGGLRSILWDGENILIEADSGGSTVARYTMAPQLYGSLISQRRSGATSFHHFDALGSTRALTNAAQTPTDTADYKAFGLTNASSGSTTNPFRWVGRYGYYRQPDTEDHWLRGRVYREGPGRFLSRDPIRQVNLYAFPGNSPVMIVDPSGMQGCGAPSTRRTATGVRVTGSSTVARALTQTGTGLWNCPEPGEDPRDVCPDVWNGPAGSPYPCPITHQGHTFTHATEGYKCLVCVPPDWDVPSEVDCTGITWVHKKDSCCLVVHKHGPNEGISCKWGHCVPGEDKCGPDVTDALHDVLVRANQKLYSLSQSDQWQYCDIVFPTLIPLTNWSYLDDIVASIGSFDIEELSTSATGTYDATIGADGKAHNCLKGERCQQTVWIEHGCYKAWAVNYALFGRLGALCGISLADVVRRVELFKLVMSVFPDYALADIRAAQAWARAGYVGARAPAPASQLPACANCGYAWRGRLTGYGVAPMGKY